MTQTCGTGGAAEYAGGLASMQSQNQVAASAFDPNAVGGPNSNLLPIMKGGSKRKSGKRARKQRGGTGIIDIVVPAGLVYANQMYKPKGAAKLYSRSRKFRGSRRHTRNNRSARRR